MDLIIFSGQSNMQGQSERLSENAVVDNAYEYKWLTDELVPLKNPVGENITCNKSHGYEVTTETKIPAWLDDHVTGSACFGHTNLVPEFCRTYTQNTAREVVAVHVAKGSTTISQWLPKTKGYEVLCEKCHDAIKKVKPERIFFVWLQGESDAIFGTKKEEYKQLLCVLKDALKSDVGIDKFGIIRVGRFTGDERDDEIICAQDEICCDDYDFLMLTDIATKLNEQKEYMNEQYSGHYNAKGLELLGKEASKTLCKIYQVLSK